MNTITDTKQFYLSSKSNLQTDNLNYPLNSHIRYSFQNILDPSPFLLYSTIKVSHCEIPYSFYIVNEYNNLFSINDVKLEIPFGNYNAIQLASLLNTLFADNNIAVSLTFDTSNGKYKITSSSLFTIQSNSSFSIVGLEENSNYTSLFNASLDQYDFTFPFPVNTGGIKTIFLKSNIITENIQSLSNNNGILKSLSVNVPPFGILIYNNTENLETLIKNKYLPYLEIALLDENNNYLDMNGLDWSICLEIKSYKQFFFTNTPLNNIFNLDLENKENKQTTQQPTKTN